MVCVCWFLSLFSFAFAPFMCLWLTCAHCRYEEEEEQDQGDLGSLKLFPTDVPELKHLRTSFLAPHAIPCFLPHFNRSFHFSNFWFETFLLSCSHFLPQQIEALLIFGLIFLLLSSSLSFNLIITPHLRFRFLVSCVDCHLSSSWNKCSCVVLEVEKFADPEICSAVHDGASSSPCRGRLDTTDGRRRRPRRERGGRPLRYTRLPPILYYTTPHLLLQILTTPLL